MQVFALKLANCNFQKSNFNKFIPVEKSVYTIAEFIRDN